MILNPGADTSIEINYKKPTNKDWSYTVQMFIVDENDVEISSGPAELVTETKQIYNFQTPNTITGVYRLKFVFVYDHGKDMPSNANTGDTLIAVDGILYGEGCEGGIERRDVRYLLVRIYSAVCKLSRDGNVKSEIM